MGAFLDKVKGFFQRLFRAQPGRRVVGGTRDAVSDERPHPTAPIIPPHRASDGEVRR
jgi:hypothetical protein